MRALQTTACSLQILNIAAFKPKLKALHPQNALDSLIFILPVLLSLNAVNSVRIEF